MDKEQLRQEQIQKLLEEGLILPKDIQEILDEKVETIKNFLSENKGISTEEVDVKDQKQKESQELWSDYSKFLNDMEYNFRITGKEFHWIRNFIVHKKIYDEQSLFVGYRVKEEFVDTVNASEVPKSDETIENLKIAIDTLTLLHHLIKDVTVSNLNDDKTQMFASILTEIGNISKLFSKYNADSEALSALIYNWTVGLEPEIKEEIELKMEEKKEAETESE